MKPLQYSGFGHKKSFFALKPYITQKPYSVTFMLAPFQKSSQLGDEIRLKQAAKFLLIKIDLRLWKIICKTSIFIHFLYNWISSQEPQNVTLYEFGRFETVLGLVALIDTLYIIKNLEISSFPQPKIEENIWLALSETNFEYEANTFFMSHCTKCLQEKRYKITFSSITSAQLIGF